MQKTIGVVIALLLLSVLSIVPWTDAQQKPQSVLMWCQDAAGNQAPCRFSTTTPGASDPGLVVRNISQSSATIGSAVPSVGSFIAGTDGTNARGLKTDTNGELQVDVLTFPDNEPFNMAQVAGAAPSATNGLPARLTDGTAFYKATTPADTQPVSLATNQPVGNVAHGATDSGNPNKIGCQARTTNRTAVTDGQRADVVCDDNGQLLMTLAAPRDRTVTNSITLTSTTETTLIAAGGAGVFRDLTDIACTNGSATLTRADIRDATAGTIRMSRWLAGNGGGFNIALPVPRAQSTANSNWTVTLSTAVTDVRCDAQAVEKN